MIEPTDEMAEVGWDALPVSAQHSGEIDLDDMKAVLAAVLAIVERDYINVDHVHRYGRICPPGNRCVYCTPGGTP